MKDMYKLCTTSQSCKLVLILCLINKFTFEKKSRIDDLVIILSSTLHQCSITSNVNLCVEDAIKRLDQNTSNRYCKSIILDKENFCKYD